MEDVRYLLMHRKVLTATALFYHQQLKGLSRSHQAWQYLKGRGITEKTVDDAKLGFSTGEGLYEHLIEEGYLHSIIFGKNLCKSNKNKDLRDRRICDREVIDFFGRGRIIFPCLEDDRTMGMISRICYETDNLAIPRYKMLGKSSYTFYSPDFLIPAWTPVYIVEGPLDVLILRQHGYSACCFLGTSGFKEKYAPKFSETQEIFCIPDAEDNAQSLKANMEMYIRISNATGLMPIVLEIPKGEGKKVDPADFFNVPIEEGTLRRNSLKATRLNETKEWSDYQRKLQNQRTKEQKKFNLLKESEKLEKFPIIETLKMLGIKVIENYGGRPTCICFNPDHEDTNPSVHIYENTQTFHCFGCSQGHDAVDAVRLVLGLEFKDAIEWLKENTHEKSTSRSL